MELETVGNFAIVQDRRVRIANSNGSGVPLTYTSTFLAARYAEPVHVRPRVARTLREVIILANDPRRSQTWLTKPRHH